MAKRVYDFTHKTAAQVSLGYSMHIDLAGEPTAYGITITEFITLIEPNFNAATVDGKTVSKSDIDPLNIDAGTVNGKTVLTDVPTPAVFTDTTYSVGDGGLTQKNFTTTLKTKLDGIEDAATADQTKSDIDSLNINADQVDGYHATTSDTLNTVAVRDASKDITAHDFIPTSDFRKKWRINKLIRSKGTEGMRVVSYSYKGETLIKYGMIAQQLQNTHPELVKTNDDGFLGLYNSSIQGLMIYDIQRLMKWNLYFMIKRFFRWLRSL